MIATLTHNVVPNPQSSAASKPEDNAEIIKKVPRKIQEKKHQQKSDQLKATRRFTEQQYNVSVPQSAKLVGQYLLTVLPDITEGEEASQNRLGE